MNAQKVLLYTCIGILLITGAGCGPAPATELPTATQDTIGTPIALTAQAGVNATLTQLALQVPTSTFTPFFTATPIPTDTMVPTPTSSKPMISVVMETLCRLGPDRVYDRVGALGIGRSVEVFALDPSRQYYFIENPNRAGTYCWLWGFYATPMNSFIGIPVYTPAFTPTPLYTATPTLTKTPTGTLTPTPNFTISNPALRTCSSSTFMDVTITNIGGIVFKSGSIAIQDNTNGLNVPELVNNLFEDKVGCDVHFTQSDLATNEVGNLSSSALPFDVRHHSLTLTVKLCPEDNLAGTCSVKTLAYTP